MGDNKMTTTLRNKLTKAHTGTEVIKGIIVLFTTVTMIAAAVNTTGFLMILLWTVVAIQFLGIVFQMTGQKTVVLSPDEQAFLKEHYNL